MENTRGKFQPRIQGGFSAKLKDAQTISVLVQRDKSKCLLFLYLAMPQYPATASVLYIKPYTTVIPCLCMTQTSCLVGKES